MKTSSSLAEWVPGRLLSDAYVLDQHYSVQVAGKSALVSRPRSLFNLWGGNAELHSYESGSKDIWTSLFPGLNHLSSPDRKGTVVQK